MATISTNYAASTAITFTSADSLASDTNLLAGAGSLAVNNTSTLYLDAYVGGRIKVGGSALTADRRIQLWLYAALNDTPDYPAATSGNLGTDAQKTLQNSGARNAGLVLVRSIAPATTASLTYDVLPFSVASYFGGVMPLYWGLFIVQDTAVALDATAAAVFKYTGIKATSA